MKSSPAPRQRKLVTAMLVAGATCAITAQSAFAIPGVEITGTNTDFGNQTFLSGTNGVSKEQLCTPGAQSAGDVVATATHALKQRLSTRLGPSTELQGLSSNDVMQSMGALCTDPDDSSTAPFKIIYSACRMTMDSPDQTLDIVLPPGGEAGRMDMVDFRSSEVYHVSLQRNVSAAEAATSAWGSAIDIDSGTTGESIAGHGTRKYNFSYTGGLGGGEDSPMGGLATVKNTGTVWIADGVDGIATVQAFYTNMTREIDPAQAEQGFVAGLINNLVKMLQNGLPLRMKQTVETSMMGMAGTSHRSHMEVYGSQEIDLPADWCAQNFIPEGFTVRDIDQEISDAMSGGGTEGEGAGASMQDLQNMMNEAMKDMTPEQREMMKSMDMGAMQQMMQGQTAQPTPADKDE